MEQLNRSKNETSKLLRRVLLGTMMFSREPIMIIGRWKVYKIKKVQDSPADQDTFSESLNFEIVGSLVNGKMEKILVRFYLNKMKETYKIKYYYLLSSTDPELAYLVTHCLITRIINDYPFSFDYEIKDFQF